MADEQKKLERFGRYLILDHFVDGGMAKICRARYLGEQADKIVAIKMVQPQYSSDPSFKTMFMDEIKVTFGLIHPNVVQTYDYGLHNNQLYVAMEYCDGRNLKEYLDKLRERKFVFPVEISVYIITQVAQGLHYAHTLSDKLTGKEAHIIHRDISPHNIMLTYDGAIKIIDFGIAKASSNSEATQAGTIKGKLSYLAPEYLEGKELDGRYDQFAVGITLWEMLCSRKLFKANNDLAVLKKIQECKIAPPSSVNPNVPKELDEIVMKCLSKERTKRYESMDHLNRALIKFLYSNYPDFNATDLAYFAKELFKEEIKKDREKLFEFGKIDIRPYIEEIKREAAGIPSSSSDTTDATSAQKENFYDFGFGPGEEKTTTKTQGGTRVVNKSELIAKKSATRKINVAEMEKNSELSVGHAPKKVSRSKMAESGNRTGIKKYNQTGASKTRTGVSQKSVKIEDSGGKRGFMVAGVAIAAVAGIIYFKFPHILGPEVGERRGPSSIDGQSTKLKDAQVSNVRKPQSGKIIIANFDKYKQRAFVNGKEVEISVLGEVSVPVGRDLILRIQTPGQQHFVKKLNIADAVISEKITIPQMPYAAFGYLNTSRACITGKLFFTLYGEERVENLPINLKGGLGFPLKFNVEGEPAPTQYDVSYQKDTEDFQRKLSFTFKFENDSLDFCTALFRQTQ